MLERKQIVIIQGNPDPSQKHLCHGLAGAYAKGASSAGHIVTTVTIADLDFPILRTKSDFEHGILPAILHAARDAIVAADHIVFVFPLWLGGPPALLKAFLEQIMRPGIAFENVSGSSVRTLLKGRSAHIIVTMGMPAWIYRWYFRSHGVKSLKRNILEFVGIKPVKTTLLGMVEGRGASKRIERWLKRMHDAGYTGS